MPIPISILPRSPNPPFIHLSPFSFPQQITKKINLIKLFYLSDAVIFADLFLSFEFSDVFPVLFGSFVK